MPPNVLQVTPGILEMVQSLLKPLQYIFLKILALFQVILKGIGEFGSASTSQEIKITPPPPIPAFQANSTESTVKETIQFSNTSQLAESYLWDFGDTNSSIEMNPSHRYSNPGTYTVSLTAKGLGGEETTTQIITVLPADLTAKFFDGI